MKLFNIVEEKIEIIYYKGVEDSQEKFETIIFTGTYEECLNYIEVNNLHAYDSHSEDYFELVTFKIIEKE